MDNVIARCATTEMPSGVNAPEWVHLLPAGNIEGVDGRTFVLGDAKAVIAASSQGADLPIDYEHQIDDPEARSKDGVIPAAGWIKELEMRDDGIWGRVEWTEKARNMIAAKEYRYLSPVLIHTKLGRTVVSLKGASLVHRPNLHLTALSSARLPAPAQDASLALIKSTLGLNAETDAATVLATLRERITPDPAKFVPVDVVADLLRDRNTKVALMSERDAVTKVEKAVDGGYITPAMRDWAVALCKASPDSFDGFLTSATPAYAHLFTTIAANRQVPNSVQPEADPNSVAAILGLDPKRLD